MANVTSSAHVVLLIPAWHPEPRLVDLVQSLRDHEQLVPVVVLDGLQEDDRPIVSALEGMEGVHLLRHAVNMGKGRALKTGFNWVLNEMPASIGVVTADADGQHLPEDILHVADTLMASPRRFVLGSRAFDQNVPFRSRLGNTTTRIVFWFLAGRRIRDTQSGLRGLPVHRLAELLTLDGERYEYEMNMLAHLCRAGAAPLEVPIKTVYIESNRSSHFDPIRDSMRIYFVLLRFYVSSLFAAGIDFAGFTVAFAWTHNILVAMFVGRLSSIANFLLNRRYVFQSSTGVRGALWRYYALVLVLAGISYESIRLLSVYLGWNVLAAKIVTETLLSLASFALQRIFVFPAQTEDA